MRKRMFLYALSAAFAASTAFAAGGGGGGMAMPSANAAPEVDLKAEYKAGLEAISAANYKKAIRHLRTVTSAMPKFADGYNWLGYSYRKAGDAKAALKNYQKALKIDPNHAGANEYLGELYLEMKDLAKAEERMAVLNACCSASWQAKQLADALAEYKAKGSFTAKPPMISY